MNSCRSGKKKILVISYFYAPVDNPRSYRWTAITEYWGRQGHQVDVVCSWSPGQTRYETVNGPHVHRVGIGFLDKMRAGLRRTVNVSNMPNVKGGSAVGTCFRRWVLSAGRTIKDYVWKNLSWPDSTCLWYFPARRHASSLLVERDHEYLISVSPSFTSHAVGLFLKRKKPEVKWIVDIGDPFCFLEESQPNNFRIYRTLNVSYEGKIFHCCDAVAVTTELALERYTQIFPECSSKINVIPPLLSVEPDATGDRFFSKRNKIRLVYVGTLYRHIREPDFLLRLFEKLLHTSLSDRLELHFLGDFTYCRKIFELYGELLGKKIFLHGLVERKRVIEAMREADVLVNIGNDTLYQLPSKVVEYASMGKPVLNLAKTEKDSSAAFFKTYPAALCLVDTAGKTDSEHLERLYRFIVSGLKEVDSHSLKGWISPFQIESISAAYADLVDKSTETPIGG